MSRHDAYGDEMRLRRPYDPDDAEFASLAEEIRSACLGAPGPQVQARHLRMIIEQTRAAPETPYIVRPPTPRRSRPHGVLAKLGVAAAGLALLTGSLAVAGVDFPILPDRASDKAGDSSAGKEGASLSETAQRVQSAIEANLPLLQAGDISGCEFGAMVSAAARGVEPDTSRCGGDDAGEEEGAGGERSETAQRVRATIEDNLPLLQAGDISGCEFGAMVSAAARGVEPDTSRCERASKEAGAGLKDSKEKGDPTTEESAPGNSTPKKPKGKKQAAGDGAASPDDAGADNKNDKADTNGEDKGQGTDEAPGQGEDAPPAGKPGGKSNGD
ncbi:MAG TPA: hypothetical protein VFA00_14510 [Actinomycetota bacterium]|nr:hypothetical protein [Actinomycetota bacterium]